MTNGNCRRIFVIIKHHDMRFTPEHYETLKQSIVTALQRNVKSKIIDIQTLENISKSKNASETRFLWDLFWLGNWSALHRDQCNSGNYRDAHITTALRQVVKDLKAGNYVTVVPEYL